MTTDMRVFGNNDFEMALITYKRPKFVEAWLSQCLADIGKCNIVLSVYDSSDDDETKEIVLKQKNMSGIQIEYYRLPPSTTGGYKYIPPILNTKCKSIMIVGDSRCHSIKDLNNTVFKYINTDYDLIVLSYYNNFCGTKEYTDLKQFLSDCFISITCCGFTIFKTSVFDNLRQNESYREQLDKKYKDLYGFAYLGYYLECYSNCSKRSLFVSVPWQELLATKKHAYWKSQFYECWCDELCQIMDCLPNEYGDKDDVLKKTWRTLGLDSFGKIVEVKKSNAISKHDYRRMKKYGYLKRVTNRTFLFRIIVFSNIRFLLFIQKVIHFFKR